MYQLSIIKTISKDYEEINEFDINNFEKILYNVYSSHKNLFNDNALDILFMYYKYNNSYEEISKKYNIPIKKVLENLTNTFNILKTEDIKKKFLLKNQLKDEILIDELDTSIRVKTFLKTNNIKTINKLLTHSYSTLENLPNISNELFTKIIIATRKWIIKNKYNIKDWPR